jgi:ArsR family transcriptional regulator
MDISEMFKALGDETRLRILNLVSKHELCVCIIEETLGLMQPNVSKHLSRLKHSGIISCRKISQWCFFRVNEKYKNECGKLCEYLEEEWAKGNPYARDLRKLEYLLKTNDCCQELLQKAKRSEL